MLKRYLIYIFLLFSGFIYGAVNVAVGTAPEKYIIEQIGGDKVNVFCIMPEGKNLHDFAVTPDMLRNTAQCQIFFHTDLLFEQQILKMLRSSRAQTCNLALNVPKITEKNSHHHNDVHTWFSYNSLIIMAKEAERNLSEIDGANAAYYFQNRVNFCNQIISDRRNAEKILNRLPQRVFLTHHAAFGYFAREFNLHQHAFEFNGREITPKNLVFISKFARRHKIKRIFIQSTASENVKRAIKNATGASLVIVDPADYDILGTLNRFTAELEASFE